MYTSRPVSELLSSDFISKDAYSNFNESGVLGVLDKEDDTIVLSLLNYLEVFKTMGYQNLLV